MSAYFETLLHSKYFTYTWQLLIAIVLSHLIAKWISRLIQRFSSNFIEASHSVLVRKICFYLIFCIFIALALELMGFDLRIILGAAGIFTLAIGFAAQTSMSNLISGLFLMFERPFSQGDFVKIAGVSGLVDSTDFLATKIRTFDNALIRIPNETIMKGECINYTYFPMRRVDIDIPVAYEADLEKVRSVLFDVLSKETLCRKDPAPLFYLKEFGPSAIIILLGVWCNKSDYTELRNRLFIDIRNAFQKEKIEFPYPHIALYAGNHTRPFPVETVSSR
jgi:small-conductance mechanosensitive channel